MIRRISLQTRICALLVLLLAILWTMLLVDAQRGAREIAGREVAIRLNLVADVLQTISEWPEADRSRSREILEAAGRPFESDSLGAPVYELSRGRTVLVRSEDFPTFLARPGSGLSVAVGAGEPWTILTVTEAFGGVTRRTALPRTAQDARIADLASERMLALNLLLPLFGIGILASIWLGLRPLRVIRQRIAEIDPNAPAPLGVDPGRMPREVADLAEAFDALAARLSRVMTSHRIFASVASHELRTPLAGAISQLDVLKRDPASQAASRQLVESLRHMDRLVSQLLALAREEASVSAKGPGTFDVVAIVQDLRSGMTPDDTASRIELTVPEAPVTMTGYPDLVRALLRNLVQNALTASGELPVSLAIRAAGDEVRVVIADRGPGFPAGFRRDGVDPVNSGGTARGTGTGLGLIVAQRIAELHRGRIEFADGSGGARVTVTLPRTIAAVKD